MAAKSKRDKMSAVLMQGASQNVKKNIKIEPELQSLIPPLSEDELISLEESIIKEGCRDPLVVWENGDSFILVDGHNRFGICKRLDIDFKTKTLQFTDMLAAKNWMLANQMSRRNLSPLQMSYLRGLRYETEKLSVGRQKEDDSQMGQNVPFNERTSEKLSLEYNVNEKTIRRDARFTNGLNRLTGSNQQLRWKILNGEIQAKKETVSKLADQEDNTFIEQLQAKLTETEDLDKALKLLMVLGNAEGEGTHDEVTEAQALYKNLNAYLKKIVKLDRKDPKRKKLLKEAKDLFDEFLKL